MKKFEKLLALLLALAMVFSLAACAASDDDDDDDKKSSKKDKETVAVEKETEAKEELSDEEKIIGKWVYQADMSSALAKELEGSLDKSMIPNAAFNMNIGFEFAKNGDLTISMEIDKTSMDNYMSELVDTMVEYMYAEAEKQNMSKADFDKAIKDQSGMTVEEYIKSELNKSIGDSMDINESVTGCYKVDANKNRIYVGETKSELNSEEEYMSYTFNGDKLKVTEFIEDGERVGALGLEEYGIELPFVFEKQ